MKKYTSNGKLVVEVDDLSFLYDRKHYSWIGRERLHFRHKKALKIADIVIALNRQAAEDTHKYYRVPYDKITTQTNGN